MDVEDLLTVLQTKGTEYGDIARELIRRCEKLEMRDVTVALSCLHDTNYFVIHQLGREIVLAREGSTAWTGLDRQARQGSPYTRLELDLTQLDELSTIHPRLRIWGDMTNVDSSINQKCIIALLQDFCLRVVQRRRAMLRRAFIEAKVGSDELGTFCHRLLNEAFASEYSAEALSIFVLDKRNGELRLRGQVPKRRDRRHLSDVTVNLESRSRIRECFDKAIAIVEHDPSGNLRKGQTVEDADLRIFSRLYWPIRLQFRSKSEVQKRVKDRIVGVLRMSNPSDTESRKIRPFHCFDAFAAEFTAESLHNIIGSYVDRDVEGFDRDLAFHAAKTPATGCLRNIRLAAQFLFDPNEVPFLDARPGAVPPQFSVQKTGKFEREELIRALNNAYAFALDISAQVERANITEELYHDAGHRIDRLFADVIQKAINLAPYIELSYSVESHWRGTPRATINKLFSLELPPPIIGDAGALTSVFKNLIENSIKYSKRGQGAMIEFSWNDEPTHVCINVRDHGIGIPPEDTERIFTRGVRSERAKQHSVRGNGLGLSYCSRVVRSFGGTIRAIPLSDGMKIEVRLKKASHLPFIINEEM